MFMNRALITRVFLLFIVISPRVSPKSKTITHELEFLESIGHQPIATLSMQQAVDIAMEHRPDLQAYDHYIEASKMAARQAWSGYLPAINFTSNQIAYKGTSGSTNTTTMSAQQLLYSFAGPQEFYRRAKKNTAVVEFLSEAAKKTVRCEVEKAFLHSWLLQNQYKFFQSLQVSTQKLYDQAVHRDKLDLLNRTDYLNETSNYAINTANVYSYKDDSNIAQRKLEFLMGKPLKLSINMHENTNPLETTRLEWDSTREIVLQPIETYYQYALQYRPEIKQGLKKIGIQKDSERIARRTQLPTVSLVATAGRQPACSEIADPFYLGREFYSYGAVFSWNIFDGLLSYFKTNEAHENMIKEILNNQQLINAIKSEVETAFYTLSKSLTQLKAQNVDYTRAKNDFEFKQQELEIGDISHVEFEVAQTEWQKSHFAWVTSYIDVAIKERDLLFAAGYPPELG